MQVLFCGIENSVLLHSFYKTHQFSLAFAALLCYNFGIHTKTKRRDAYDGYKRKSAREKKDPDGLR